MNDWKKKKRNRLNLELSILVFRFVFHQLLYCSILFDAFIIQIICMANLINHVINCVLTPVLSINLCTNMLFSKVLAVSAYLGYTFFFFKKKSSDVCAGYDTHTFIRPR